MAKKHSSAELDNVYHALSNSTRRRILTRLAREGTFPVSDLAEPFQMSLAAVSKHIKVLEKAGLVQKRRKGTTLYCEPTLEPIRSAAALIQYFEQFLPEEEAQELTTGQLA
jgi:DNA-binding transcriptional ArsR family regulator